MRWLNTFSIALLFSGLIQAESEVAITVSFERHEIKVPVRRGITLGALIKIAQPKFKWHEKIEDYTEAEWNASLVVLRGERISIKRDETELIKPSEGTNQIRLLTDERLSIKLREGDVLRSTPLSIL